jgi:hypothetical protein
VVLFSRDVRAVADRMAGIDRFDGGGVAALGLRSGPGCCAAAGFWKFAGPKFD